MPRPKKCRWISEKPSVTYFRPMGIPMRRLEHVVLAADELESLRLADLEGLSHEEAAQAMNVSRATFGRIVARARKQMAEALILGKGIVIGDGPVVYEGDHPCGKKRRCRMNPLPPLGDGHDHS